MTKPEPEPVIPDLEQQLEDLIMWVWFCETWEERHPFTAGVIRESAKQVEPQQ